ncbi:MAG TPA: carbohydrate kinase [Candidatus Limiplasma sp.]|nr:carbohydrate kinase [Candidatus Limiplasma sp.]
MKPYDVVAIGECLIDFVCTRGEGKLAMEGNAGGAPANVLAMAAKLGHRTAMISKVGADAFGAFLCEQLASAGIDSDYLLRDADHPTTLAIVQLDKAGNRSFSFYRDRTADVMLRADELPVQLLQSAGILHFGSLSLTAEPVRSATFEAIRIAKDAGAVISYDPNLRPPLWPNLEEARAMLCAGLARADLVKMSEEELQFISGETDLQAGIRKLNREYSLQLLAVTLGERGCLYSVNGQTYASPAFDTHCVDTTGAGDASWGAALSWMMERRCVPKTMTESDVYTLMDFANAAGSLATTRMGAIPAMPDRDTMEACIRTTPRLLF